MEVSAGVLGRLIEDRGLLFGPINAPVCRYRSLRSAQALASAIASTKVMKAKQVVKGDTGEELLVPFQDTPVEVEQNTDLPDYLPEDESSLKEQDKAVSRVGVHQDSGNNWLSTAANFLSRSFYW